MDIIGHIIALILFGVVMPPVEATDAAGRTPTQQTIVAEYCAEFRPGTMFDPKSGKCVELRNPETTR